jgi:hypothetical protein
MGRREHRRGRFIYEVNLDEVLPAKHLVLRIDAVLDLGWIYKELALRLARRVLGVFVSR